MCIISEDKECGREILKTSKKVVLLESIINELKVDVAVANNSLELMAGSLKKIGETVEKANEKTGDRMWGIIGGVALLVAGAFIGRLF